MNIRVSWAPASVLGIGAARGEEKDFTCGLLLFYPAFLAYNEKEITYLSFERKRKKWFVGGAFLHFCLREVCVL